VGKKGARVKGRDTKVRRGEWGAIGDMRVGLRKGEGTVRMQGRRECIEGREVKSERLEAWSRTG
jgi:hypothetical protein